MGKIKNNNNSGRGVAGGRRDTVARSAKQKTRRERRLADPRVQAAMEETRAAQEELEKLMNSSSSGKTEGAIYQAQKKLEAAQEAQYVAQDLADKEEALGIKPPKKIDVPLKARIAQLPESGESKNGWTLGQARSMLMQGYTIFHVVKMTGFGTKWFNDIRLDKEGRGCSREEWIEDQEKKASRMKGLSK